MYRFSPLTIALTYWHPYVSPGAPGITHIHVHYIHVHVSLIDHIRPCYHNPNSTVDTQITSAYARWQQDLISRVGVYKWEPLDLVTLPP